MKSDIRRIGAVEVPLEAPLCTLEQIDEARQIVVARYADYVAPLPDDDAWNATKMMHQIMAGNAVRRLCNAVFPGIASVNLDLLQFIGEVHDLGQAAMSMNRRGIPVPDHHKCPSHGLITITLLQEWGVLDLFGSMAKRAIGYAISLHDQREIPAWAPVNDAEKVALLAAYAIRDADKLAIFERKVRLYLKHHEEKRQQIIVNGLAGEKYSIEPEELIADFEAGHTIDLSRCVSYEAWVLQMLAWIHDINFQWTLDQIRDSGAIYEIDFYLAERLPHNQIDRIRTALRRVVPK